MTAQIFKHPVQPETSVVLQGISWNELEQLDTLLKETGARLTYLAGRVEIMSPLSEAHEESKRTLGLLVETYFRVKGIRFYGRGGPTIGNREDGARKEPDECYNLETRKPLPDLVLEITVTSGGIDKLEIYQKFKISEVWFWEDGTLSVYCWRETGYEKVAQSELLPELDLDLLAKCSRMADQYDAVTKFRQMLQSP
jgi:Uma2 family endonuclease